MNDFTKDELHIFHEELDCGIYDELRSKIQSMIDNYCDHESGSVRYLSLDSDGVGVIEYECKKCGEVVK